MQRARTVLAFILRSVFGSKVGWVGLLLVLLKPLWNIFTAWQAVDFASGRMTLLFDFLNGFWGPFVITIVGFLLIGKAVYNRWPQSPELRTQELRALDNEALRQRCCKLSTEIFEFYWRQRQHKQAALQSDYMSSLYNDPARDQIRSDIAASHDGFMVDKYSELFGGNVLPLTDDLAKHNYITPENQKRFENPTKPQDILYIAQRLKALCNNSN